MLKYNLRRLLCDRNMNMSDLKRKSGINYNTITAYYHGYIKRMNVTDLIKICDTLGCSLNELMEYTPKEKPYTL